MNCNLLRRLSVVLQQEGLYNYYDLSKVATLLSGIVEMDALSLNYWLKKLVMEVARKTGKRYPLVNYLRNSLCYATPSPQLKSRLVILNKDLMVKDFFRRYFIVFIGGINKKKHISLKMQVFDLR